MISDAHAETSMKKFLPKYDAVLLEKYANPDNITESIWFYENIQPNKNGDGYESNTVFSNQSSFLENNNFDLPVGPVYAQDDRLYLVFDLKKILPKHDIRTEQIIDSVKLKALVEAYDTTAYKTLLTVNICHDSSWHHTFENMTEYCNQSWPLSNQSCFYSNQPQDAIVANRSDLPQVYEWDVTEGVNKEIGLGYDDVTFVIFGTPFSEKHPSNSFSTNMTGLVSFTSFATASSNYSIVGTEAVPSLVVTYETLPTIPDILGNSSNQLTLLSIAIPAIAWFYREEIKKHANKLKMIMTR